MERATGKRNFEIGDGWAEVSREDLLKELEWEGSVERDAPVLDLLMTEPSTRGFIRVEAEGSDARDSSLDYLVPGTRIFVDRSRAMDLRGDVLAGMAVWALSRSLTWSATVALFRKAAHSVQRLTESETEILRIVLRLADNDRPVPVDAIEKRFRGSRADLDRDLAQLSRRGVLWPEGVGWRVAR